MTLLKKTALFVAIAFTARLCGRSPVAHLSLACTPEFTLPIINLGAGAPFGSISLHHRLINRGDGFTSFVTPAELDSSVSKSWDGHAIWRTFEGAQISFKGNDDVRRIDSEIWSYHQQTAASCTVSGASCGKTFYYRSGRLVRLATISADFAFLYGAVGIDRVVRTVPCVAEILRIVRTSRGYKIVAGAEESCDCVCNEIGSIVSASASSHPKIRCEYGDGLLVSVESGAVVESYTWSLPHWKPWWHPMTSVAPVVVKTSSASLDVSATSAQLSVAAYGVNGTTTHWIYRVDYR